MRHAASTRHATRGCAYLDPGPPDAATTHHLQCAGLSFGFICLPWLSCDVWCECGVRLPCKVISTGRMPLAPVLASCFLLTAHRGCGCCALRIMWYVVSTRDAATCSAHCPTPSCRAARQAAGGLLGHRPATRHAQFYVRFL